MERSPELQAIITGWFAAVARGDAAWVERHVSREAGVRLVGTDPAEWLEGERVAEFLTGEVVSALGGGGITIEPRDAEAFREGSVGWGVTRPTLTLPNGRTVSPRWSAVFHREGGEWKLVQVHASVGVAN
jgi:hypothetical protein